MTTTAQSQPRCEPATLGARLRQYIVLNRMTVTQFSKLTGATYRALQDWLHDNRKPSADQLAGLARAGVNIEWLLTGEVRPQIVFDMGAAAEAAPLTGIVLADHELSTLLLREAITLVERQLRASPELFGRLGMDGALLSIWSLFSSYARAVDQIAPQIEAARRAGWDVAGIAKVVTCPLREHMEARLRDVASEVLRQDTGAPALGDDKAAGGEQQ